MAAKGAATLRSESENRVTTGTGLHRGAPLPANEADRLKFLQGLNILDSVAEDAFDNITRVLTHVFNTPIALISLVDANRQWFKSAVGLSDKETLREVSCCAHVPLPEGPVILLVPVA